MSNPANPNSSSGIRCANGSLTKATGTLVADNALRNCGLYGIFMQNHGASLVSGNLILESERSGLVVHSSKGLEVRGNVVFNSDTSHYGGQASIYVLKGASDVRLRGNRTANVPGLSAAAGRPWVVEAQPGANDIEPRILHGDGPPETGAWRPGDRVLVRRPKSGGPSGWVCVAAGVPGVWRALAAVSK